MEYFSGICTFTNRIEVWIMRLQNRILILFSLLFTVGFLFLMSLCANAVEKTNRKMVDSFSTQSCVFK